MMGVTTVSALLCRISGSAQVPFDGLLRGLCDILAARFGRSGGPRLVCVAADEALPIGAVTLFALIADLLVTDAFLYAFPPGGAAVSLYPSRPGRPGCSLSRTAGSPCEPVVAGATMA
jgi:hypothetical protein